MASGEEEVAIRRIIACFAPGRGASPEAVTRLAKELRAELLGLFIEDAELLRFAALPFAAEIGFPSAVRRALDQLAVERMLRAQGAALKQALAASLGGHASWSFRVARAAPADAVAAALAEGRAPSLVIPPGGDPRAERSIVFETDLGKALLGALLAAGRPVVILPRASAPRQPGSEQGSL
jgi:hypothetical protein